MTSTKVRIGAWLSGVPLVPEQDVTLYAGLNLIVGENGSGKSLLFSALANPERLNLSYDIAVTPDLYELAKAIPKRRMLGQATGQFFLASTVSAEIEATELLRRIPSKQLDAYMSNWLADSLIERTRKLTHLSRGQFQSVAVGMDLFDPPRWLLLDEPDSFLDDANFQQLASRVLSTAVEFRRTGKTILLATHRLDDWMLAASAVEPPRVVRLKSPERRTSGLALSASSTRCLPATPAFDLPRVRVRETKREIGPLRVAAGNFFTFIGPNASGKSSVLRAVYRQLRKDGRSGVAYVPDWSADLGDTRTVGDCFRGLDAWSSLLDQVGIKADRQVSEHSWGQRRLISFLEALERSDPILVADEPLCGLDGNYSTLVARLLSDFASRGGCAYVTTNRRFEADLLAKHGSVALDMAEVQV